MVVEIAVRILELIVIVHVFLGYFMSPYHPIREIINRIVEPMLAPIRRVVPLMGMLDFSPFILLILIQIVGQILITLLRSLV
jgi:YggT family protein